MPILDIQKRARELGRIRLGQKGPSGAPQKLDRFRFTGHSETLLTKIADLYGGEVREWTPAGGTSQWEVISDTARVPIMVPPQPVSQWYEHWTRAGCQHRCDGRTNVLTDEPCDPEDPKHIEATKRPTTRLNVVLRDVEGIGVWRVESHGFNAAIELPDVAEFLAQAGGYVNGWLSLEQRTSVEQTDSGPKTRHYMVPIIEVDVTPAQLMAGHGRVAAPALAGGPVKETPALAAAGPDYVALAADLTDPEKIRDLWRQANGAGHMTQGLSEHLQKRVAEVEAAAAQSGAADDPATASEPDADGVVEGEIVPDAPAAEAGGDADAVWQQVVATAGRLGWGTEQLTSDFKDRMGFIADEATAEDLSAYLELIRAEVAA
jgi:hypothetical protein